MNDGAMATSLLAAVDRLVLATYVEWCRSPRTVVISITRRRLHVNTNP